MPAPRLVVPQVEDLAARLSPSQIACVRMQAQPGECVAIYERADLMPCHRVRSIRVIITGPNRQYLAATSWIDGNWRRIGAVEITEDGERALPQLQ